MSDPVRFHVFLSHSTSDKPAVEEIAERLQREGIEPWLDKWNLIPGDAWQPAIEDALRACASCAVFIGPEGFGAWHNEEMRAAIGRRVTETKAAQPLGSKPFRVIPVLLPTAHPPELSRLPSFLQATTWVEFQKTLDDEAALHRLISGIRGVPPGPGPGKAVLEGECPYRGLESFEKVHARFFFGRERLTQELIFRLRPSPSGQENRFLTILGASGSGKSSLARAGLVPALERGELEGSAEWPVAILKPGSDPLESLSVALAKLDGGKPTAVAVQGLMSALRAEENTLHLTTRLALSDAPTSRRIVLLIDQFEEIFTLCEDEKARKALIANLIYAATITGGRTVVVLTMRADFYGKCGPYSALAAAMSDHQLLVGPMTEEEIRLAIEQPALLAGGEFDRGLVDILLRDVEGRPAALPLLQFALTELWQRRDGRRLTAEAYRAIGGLEGALKNRADDVLKTFDADQRELCRRIFLSLTQPGEGTEDTKRRASFGELVAAGTDAGAVESVIGRLADARLITTGQDPNDPSKNSVEVAHEALIRGWSQLRTWVDSDRQGLRTHRRLTESAVEWEQHGRAPDFLFTGARLATTREWSESHGGELSPLEVDFLAASLAAGRKKKDEEVAAARDRQLLAEAEAARALEAQQRAEERLGDQHRLAEAEAARAIERIHSQRKLTIGLALGLVVAAGLSAIAWRESAIADAAAAVAKNQTGIANEKAALATASAAVAAEQTKIAKEKAVEATTAEVKATEQAQHADVLRLAAQATLRQGDQYDLALLLSVEAHRTEPNYETRTTLLSTLSWNRRLNRYQHGHMGGVTSVAFSPDGKTLASGSEDSTIILWDVDSGKARGEPLIGHTGGVRGVAYSPDGKILASASIDSTIILWDVDPLSWETRALRKAGRNLSLLEWRKYFGEGTRYRRTSLKFPPGIGVSEADLAPGEPKASH